MRVANNRGVDRRSPGRGGGEAPSYALADKVYDLSLALGELRARSVANVDALRSVAQGVPELDQAFQPLLAALEAGLAECHQADLEAIFGRPEPLRDMLESPPPPQIGRGFGRVRGGGTGVAAQRLANALSVLDRDVEAAGMLVDDGASLRTVVRWVRRARAASQAAPADPALEGEVLSEDHGESDDDVAATKSASSADNGEGAAKRDASNDWTLRIFREPTAAVDSDCAVDGGSGSGSVRGSSSAPYHAGVTDDHAGTTDSRSRDESCARLSRCPNKSGQNGRRRPPLVVVNALRVPLPPVAATPTTAAAKGARVTAPRRGLDGAGSAPALRSEWRNPFSWLAGYYWRGDGEECRAPGPSLSMAPPPVPPPPPPPLASPRVIVRVVYVGRAPDIARFARAAERLGEVQECAAASAVTTAAAAPTGTAATAAPTGTGASATAAATGAAGGCASAGASLAAGDGYAPRPNAAEGTTVDATQLRLGATGKSSAAVVELVRSEVRVRRACVPAAAARDDPERACTNGADSESGLVSRSATQLQIVLKLRTRAPVVVLRVLHTGGGVSPHPHLCLSSATPPSSSREVPVQSATSSPGFASSFLRPSAISQSALPSPGLASSLLRPSAIAAGKSAAGDPAGPVEGCSGRSGRNTGLDGGGGGGGFGASVGCRDNGVIVGAGVGRRDNGVVVGDGGSEHVGTGGGGRAAGGECGQGGGSLNGGCRGQGCGIRGADEADETIPSGWVEAPAELSLPGDTDEHGPKLKVGTSHVLGMNVVLPELPSATSNPSPLHAGEPPSKPPLQRTSFCEERRASAPRGGVWRAGEAQAETPPTSKKRKSSFGGTGDDQQNVHSSQAERQGAVRSRAKKRSRFGNDRGALVPDMGAGGRTHDVSGGGSGGGGGRDSGGGGGNSGDCGGGGGGDDGGNFARQGGNDDGSEAREVKRERKTWWGWRLPSLWGLRNGGEMLLPDTSPAQQQRPQQTTQIQESSLSGISDVQASGSTTEGHAHGVHCDTETAWNGAARSRGATEGVGPSSENEVPRENSCYPPLKRSPVVITVVLAPPAEAPS